MQYVFLLYMNETERQFDTEEAAMADMKRWFDYTESLRKAGIMLGGEALQDTHTATSVRMDDKSRLTTDGPFAETKEQLGGFYLVECPDLDTALEWAEKCPAAQDGGTVEVRPVMQFDN